MSEVQGKNKRVSIHFQPEAWCEEFIENEMKKHPSETKTETIHRLLRELQGHRAEEEMAKDLGTPSNPKPSQNMHTAKYTGYLHRRGIEQAKTEAFKERHMILKELKVEEYKEKKTIDLNASIARLNAEAEARLRSYVNPNRRMSDEEYRDYADRMNR